jgi:hypothetical protein
VHGSTDSNASAPTPRLRLADTTNTPRPAHRRGSSVTWADLSPHKGTLSHIREIPRRKQTPMQALLAAAGLTPLTKAAKKQQRKDSPARLRRKASAAVRIKATHTHGCMCLICVSTPGEQVPYFHFHIRRTLAHALGLAPHKSNPTASAGFSFESSQQSSISSIQQGSRNVTHSFTAFSMTTTCLPAPACTPTLRTHSPHTTHLTLHTTHHTPPSHHAPSPIPSLTTTIEHHHHHISAATTPHRARLSTTP